MTTLNLPQEALQLLPHRPPMALVDRLLASDGTAARAEATVAAEHLFARAGGELDPIALVEMFAQTYAAMQGFEDLCKGRPVKEGFLVGIRRIRIDGRARVGDRIEVAVRTVGAIDGFAVAEGEVRRGAELLASGSLKLWIPEPRTGGETDA
jgi:predicted hotdog family 3-hydroxylacyl-ACP dehydratase